MTGVMHGIRVLEVAEHTFVPAASAVHVDGERAYARMRRGEGVAPPARHVRVERLDAQHVETASAIIEARTVVVCAGPWTRSLVPRIPTTTTLEHVGYVHAGTRLPIFIDFAEPAIYGLPTPGSDLYKIAVHHGGPAIDPDREFVPDPDARAALQHAIERWLPGAELEQLDICPYDNTADEEFIVERIDGIVVGAGTSGHAFKFGPLLGEQLARLVLDDR